MSPHPSDSPSYLSRLYHWWWPTHASVDSSTTQPVHQRLSDRSAPQIQRSASLGSQSKPSAASERILFYHWYNPHYGFTNFSPHRVIYDGNEYPTSEHLFQAFKVHFTIGLFLTRTKSWSSSWNIVQTSRAAFGTVLSVLARLWRSLVDSNTKSAVIGWMLESRRFVADHFLGRHAKKSVPNSSSPIDGHNSLVQIHSTSRFEKGVARHW